MPIEKQFAVARYRAPARRVNADTGKSGEVLPTRVRMLARAFDARAGRRGRWRIVCFRPSALRVAHAFTDAVTH
jgi:hypothetical protein